MRRPWLLIIWVVAVAAYAGRAVWVDIDQARQADPAHAAAHAAHDFATLQGERFAILRAHLPPVGTVGFLSVANDGKTTHARRYDILQYALVPLIVHDDPDERIVVASFPSDTALEMAIRGRHLRIIDRMGNAVPGLAVLENLDMPPSGSGVEPEP